MRIFICLIFLFIEFATAQTISPKRSWVFFNNKPSASLQSFTTESLGITDRALKRRAKVLPADKLIDNLDLPIAEENIAQLKNLGLSIHTTSRWLNAVSVSGTEHQLATLKDLSFVSGVQKVNIRKHNLPPMSSVQIQPDLKKTNANGLNYGVSITQHTRSKVVDVHALGIDGSGVLLGMNDDGFNYHRNHLALKNIPVVAEYDFVQRDGNTSIESGEYPGQGNHGQATLSILSGFQEGSLIGAAYGVSVVLAKTENIGSETTIEEDNYVEALEWMERLGVDIVSTSLGYDDLDPMGLYNDGDVVYNMKNGRTGKTSIAASILARKGVLLVTAMGNEYWTKKDTIQQRDVNGNITNIIWETKSGTGSLITPADADSIISVGATSSNGFLTTFSSTGPTADGRIKPEVVNQGSSVYYASGSTDAIYSGGGTSFATPLTAGAAALVLSAHPELTPMQIREALMNTARQDISDNRISSLSYPNNYYGWGHVNALDAVLYWGLVFSNKPTITANDSAYVISIKIKSKHPLISDSLFLFHKKESASLFQQVKLSASSVTDEYFASVNKFEMDSTSIGYFSAKDNSGHTRKNPFNAPDSIFKFNVNNVVAGVNSNISNSIPLSYNLYNYPNPFNSSTTLRFDAPLTEYVEADIFNLLGQRVKKIFHGILEAGSKQFYWNGRDDKGLNSASGVYIARFKTKSQVITTKLVLLK